MMIENPILKALATLTDDELTAIATVDLTPIDAPDVVTWWVELGRLANTERLARRGGPRPTDSNDLFLAANRLTPDGYTALVASLYQTLDGLPDGPWRQFVISAGFLLAVQGKVSGRLNPLRMN